MKVRLNDGDAIVRGSERETVVQIGLADDQLLSINLSRCGPGDNERRINVVWKQGPLERDRSVSIGFAVLDPIQKTMRGANGEDLTR